MTRKDFELIAAALGRARRLAETENQRRGVDRAAGSIADALAAGNSRFDRARFLRASGAIQTAEPTARIARNNSGMVPTGGASDTEPC